MLIRRRSEPIREVFQTHKLYANQGLWFRACGIFEKPTSVLSFCCATLATSCEFCFAYSFSRKVNLTWFLTFVLFKFHKYFQRRLRKKIIYLIAKAIFFGKLSFQGHLNDFGNRELFRFHRQGPLHQSKTRFWIIFCVGPHFLGLLYWVAYALFCFLKLLALKKYWALQTLEWNFLRRSRQQSLCSPRINRLKLFLGKKLYFNPYWKILKTKSKMRNNHQIHVLDSKSRNKNLKGINQIVVWIYFKK